MINEIESITEPSQPEIETVSDLYKLEDYKDNWTYFIYFLIIEGLFHAFTGTTILAGLKNLAGFALFVTVVEIGVICLICFIYVKNQQ